MELKDILNEEEYAIYLRMVETNTIIPSGDHYFIAGLGDPYMEFPRTSLDVLRHITEHLTVLRVRDRFQREVDNYKNKVRCLERELYGNQ